MSATADITLDRFLQPYPPKAAQVIVTIYGDIVEPRGADLWMGDLISLCAGFGVNESLVRTAVSRLVGKGQLSGRKEGRRSFYALTPDAREEYHAAAELFFGRADGDCDWIISFCPDPSDQAELKRQGFACLGGDVFAGSDRPGRSIRGTAFRSQALKPDGSEVAALARDIFALDALGAEYAAFVARFARLNGILADDRSDFSGETLLLLRLALVHAYRAVRLRDPRLPAAVLPVDWPGLTARTLFADLYCDLSPGADAHIARQLTSGSGTFESSTDLVEARLASLRDRG